MTMTAATISYPFRKRKMKRELKIFATAFLYTLTVNALVYLFHWQPIPDWGNVVIAMIGMMVAEK